MAVAGDHVGDRASEGLRTAATWARQAVTVHPGAHGDAAMAYDAATGTTVLFGGATSDAEASDATWTWNGTAWTRQHPATSPPGRYNEAMAYDAANGTVVMFGGVGTSNEPAYDDTWTWNGTTWTKQAPAAHPAPRSDAAMAYDAATGTVVLFGGYGKSSQLGDTWTWNGTTWAKQTSAAHPGVRYDAAMAYDAASGTAVLFGGFTGKEVALGDTWTWG